MKLDQQPPPLPPQPTTTMKRKLGMVKVGAVVDVDQGTTPPTTFIIDTFDFLEKGKVIPMDNEIIDDDDDDNEHDGNNNNKEESRTGSNSLQYWMYCVVITLIIFVIIGVIVILIINSTYNNDSTTSLEADNKITLLPLSPIENQAAATYPPSSSILDIDD